MGLLDGIGDSEPELEGWELPFLDGLGKNQKEVSVQEEGDFYEPAPGEEHHG